MSADEVQALVDNHTRAELDKMAADAGIDSLNMGSKQDVAEAIVAADPEAAGGTPGPGEEPPAASVDLPGDWTLVHEGENWFVAETYVESLGLQKVSEGDSTIEGLTAKIEAYDAHQQALKDAQAAPVPLGVTR